MIRQVGKDMKNQIKYSIVFGNDHKNPLGTIQSLGQAGVYSIAVCWGEKTGIVKSSKYTKEVYYGENAEACIDILLNCILPENSNEIGVITPCCDEAAVVLDRHRQELTQKFKFEYSTKYSLDELSEKNLQVELAKKAGLDIPECFTIYSFEDLPSAPPFPCILKPLVSMKGSKMDLRVCNNKVELEKNLKEILPHNQGIILQRYIDKEYEYLVECCRYSDGTSVAPIIIKNTKLYPPKVGLSTFHEVIPFNDGELKRKIFRLLDEMGYVGLVSVEFAKSKSDGKCYFFELNIRNDGYNPCATKSGANVNFAYCCDMLGLKKPQLKPRHIYVVSEINHFISMIHRQTSLNEWVHELKIRNGFTWSYKNDRKPMIVLFKHVFAEVISSKLKRLFRL